MRRSQLQRRTALTASPEKVREFHQRGRSNSHPQRRTFSSASPEQRDLVRGLFCLVCGETPVDPAHIIARGQLSEGQDDPRAVAPLCRQHHRDFDEGRLSILEYLEADGWRAHLAYAVERFGLISTLQRVTGTRWMEVPR